MAEWTISEDSQCGWVIQLSNGEGEFPGPQYRGAFEKDDKPPRRVRISSFTAADGSGAAVGFVSNRRFGGRRSFGVSLFIAPDFWEPQGHRGGWHFFRGGGICLGVWSVLPSSWLAQDSDGTPLKPPWSELWTFGSNHLWACRLWACRITEGETFQKRCSEWNPKDMPMKKSWELKR